MYFIRNQQKPYKGLYNFNKKQVKYQRNGAYQRSGYFIEFK